MSAYQQPVVALAEKGVVVLVGPGFEMSLTIEAALESIEQVRLAVEAALRQRESAMPVAAGLSL